MDPVQLELLGRIEAYDLAGDGSAQSFSGKLARQNRWSAAFAARVIEEYKRFAFLSVAAGHPVAPSDVVDQPWHLHLMYTQEYWGHFCPDVLGKKLHHQPGTGAPSESAKFDEWYRQTLESYERLFGEAPPLDIWPSPDRPKERASDHVRVDRARHWIVPRPHVGPKSVGTALLALALLGCAGAAASTNPLDLAGQEFLAFYTTLYAVFFGLAWALRTALRGPARGDMRVIRTLDPYSVGYLSGGPMAAANVAIAGLVNDGSLTFDHPTRQLSASGQVAQNPSQRPIDIRVHTAVAAIPGGSAQAIRNAVAASIQPIAQDLQAKGLLLTDQQARLSGLLPALVSFLPLFLGVAKVGIGMQRGRPVEILVFLLVISFCGSAAALLARQPIRTRFGDRVLATMRLKNDRLANPTNVPQDDASGTLMLGVALFGLGALAGTGLDLALRPPPRPISTWSSSGNCGGGCSAGSSCGGGGGGCGGGGGGGGCGGCSS